MQTKRSTAGALLVFSLALLAAGVLIAPLQMRAQETPAAATAKPEATKPDAPKTEEEQNAAFRLEGPLVKASAKALNLSTEKTATLFEFINFGIIALAVGIPLFRTLPKVIRKRGETVREKIETARKATEEASARLSAIEAKLAGLDEEIASFRSQVEEESKGDEARIKATLADESARIIASAEQEITSAAAQAQRTLRNFAADLAITQATQQLKLTPETDRALIAEFVGQVTSNGTAQGGQK